MDLVILSGIHQNPDKADPNYASSTVLVRTCRFFIKPKKKSAKPPKKLNTNMNSERKDKLERFLNEKLPDCKTDWEDFKLLLQEAAHYTFGRKTVVLNDWFDDQDEEIQKLLKGKNLNRNALRERIRAMKNIWFQKKAEQAEQYSQEKNHRELYATLNEVYGPKLKIHTL